MKNWTKKDLISLNNKWVATRNRGTLDGAEVVATFQDTRTPIKIMVLANGRIRRAGAGTGLLDENHHATRFISGLSSMSTPEIVEAYRQMIPTRKERTTPNPKDC